MPKPERMPVQTTFALVAIAGLIVLVIIVGALTMNFGLVR